MAEVTGSEILAKCLKAERVDDCFFIMGGPMFLAESSMTWLGQFPQGQGTACQTARPDRQHPA